MWLVSSVALSISIINGLSSAGVTLNVLENQSLYWDNRARVAILTRGLSSVLFE